MPRPGSWWISFVVAVSIGSVAVLAAAQTKRAEAVEREKGSPSMFDEKADATKSTPLEGTVKDKEGKALSGAEVLWYAKDVVNSETTTMKLVAQGKTDAEGRFSLNGRIKNSNDQDSVAGIVALQHGLAPACFFIKIDGKPLEIQLDPPVKIEGRLLKPDGEPASGIKVSMNGYFDDGSEKQNCVPMPFGDQFTWNPPLKFSPSHFVTDEAGRFVIDRIVPSGMLVNFLISSKDHAVEDLTVSTGDHRASNTWLEENGIVVLPKYFSHTMSPARPVVGTVTDAETKQPIAGLRVEVTPMREHGGKAIQTVTDSEGHYRVSDREGRMYWVAAHPQAATGYLPATRAVNEWPKGETELRIDLELRRGVTIRGRVIDEETAEPLPNVAVEYAPKKRNPNVLRGDDFRKTNVTDSDGRFEIVGVRGAGAIVADAATGGFMRRKISPFDFGYQSTVYVHGLTPIEVPTDGNAPETILKLKKGIRLEANVKGPDGNALIAVRGWCPELTARLLANQVLPTLFLDGRFVLEGAESGRVYRVFFLSRDLQFGKVAELTADPKREGPIEVKLEPTAGLKAKVLGDDGKPLEVGQVHLLLQVAEPGTEFNERNVFSPFNSDVYDNFTGEIPQPDYPASFHKKGLIPGVPYFITRNTGRGAPTWQLVEALKPGEQRDLGDLLAPPKK